MVPIIVKEIPVDVTSILKLVPSHAPKEYALQHLSKFSIRIPEGTTKVFIRAPPSQNAELLSYKVILDILHLEVANWGLEFPLEVGFEDRRTGFDFEVASFSRY